ncbi:hypothetical protein CHUAL_008235 [Chamberlinius hualienensis]
MRKFRFAIDRGGTFTDIYAVCPDGTEIISKLLSEDPQNYQDAPTEGIRRILQQVIGVQMGFPLPTEHIEWIRMGTTVATNALLERKGERMALVITKGFPHLLHIGNQSRPKLFDLSVQCPDVLYEDVIEVDERVVLVQEKCQLNIFAPVVTGVTGEKVQILKAIDEEKLKNDLKRILEKGIQSIAVVLMHSYTYNQNELKVGTIAEQLGFRHVTLSSLVTPMVKIVPRGYTACADAYLTPHIKNYLKGFSSGFQNNLEGVNVLFMQSDGGLTPMSKFNGSKAILSGPAGGVVGHAMTTYNRVTNQPIIGFDMGGTSTDVSRYDGQYEHVFESTTAGVTIQSPQLDVNTVAAGGGSMLFFRSGMFVVGPESAGADPGPACYRKGGPLTVTDANLCLGRLLPQHFPQIFGPTQNQPLDYEGTMNKLHQLTEQVNTFLAENTDRQPMTDQELALGFIRVANEAMCRPIRALTQSKGYDTSRHTLACFGGAGGQHACTIARNLGMKTVFIHRYAGILSAYGMALADVVHEAQEPCASVYSPENFVYIDDRLNFLKAKCVDELVKQGFTSDQIGTELYLHLRYEKTDCALMCSPAPTASHPHPTSGDFLQTFINRYRSEFGFIIDDRPVLIDDVRVRGVGRCQTLEEQEIEKKNGPPPIEHSTRCYFDQGFMDTNVYLLETLKANHVIDGPAIIINKTSTILVEPDCSAEITVHGDVKITIGISSTLRKVSPELDVIQLSIFSHRFMSIAEQMGRILQQTSMSTNIKERLDFSCALFGPDGGLVSNAPHIPVHLGAMQEAVQFQMKSLGDKIREGDVILSNHPSAGGTHLPDLTVITPVFYPGVDRPVFFVASRGHHADIGGITPGSMPPHSKTLQDEGATFISFYLVKNGKFQEAEVSDMLMAPGKYPGNSGTRMLRENISDLRAQVAANRRGIHLVNELIDYYELNVVQAYMAHIQTNAEIAVKDKLKEVALLAGCDTLVAEDWMDDGATIKLAVKIDLEKGQAVFDFTGTGYEVYGNCNAPYAVTVSAIIYCLRSMIGHDIPLNQGCLKPINIIVPKGTILTPSENAAVVGGNVLTSQRLVDVIFKAFGTCAASQGCMNNVTFGDVDVGYYETVAGGAGAGPHWNGRSGVHTHMTNTRITDPEILERRFVTIIITSSAF